MEHEEVALDRVGGEFDGSVVGGQCLVATSCSCEKVGACRMVGLVIVKGGDVDASERGEPLVGAVELGDGHRPVEGDNCVGAQSVELVVEGDDLGPVGGLGAGSVGVHGGYGGLDLERSGPVAPQAGAHELVALGYQCLVPAGAVLVGEAHHGPVGAATGGPAGFGEQHQGEQADGFGFVGHQLDKGPPEPDGFGR